MTSNKDSTQAKSGVPLAGAQVDAKESSVIIEHHGVRRSKTAGGLDPIASALRRLHDDVASEPIPDDFMSLLASIDEKRERRPS